MQWRSTDPMATREEAEVLAGKIRANADRYSPIIDMMIGKLNGDPKRWVVTYLK